MEAQCQDEKPLRANSFKVRDKQFWNRFRGRFFSKAAIAGVLVLIIILIILVIVLGVLLGKEKAARDKEKTGNAQPEIQGATPFPGPTTPGTEVWWNVRLPKYIVPKHYDVILFVDLKKFRRDGHVTIHIDVKQPTEYVLVHTKDLNVTSVAVYKGDGGELAVKNPFWFEKNQFYVIPMEATLEQGEYVLKMEFDAELKAELGGFYRMEYKKKDGTAVTVAATQFAPADARKTFPCFDEPAMKATFNITLVHDPKLIALSNMPVYHSEEKDDWKYDHYQKTVVMSTYLVAFAVCDFSHTEFIAETGVKVRMYAPQDRIDQAAYASEISNKLFTFFEDYFEIKYSLPKSDMIAIPNFLYGAMENWGLITYRDWNLLFKPGVSSALNKQRVAEVVAHELAHMWFGNLVTMEWWDDIWLNEGFASFMEFPAKDFIHPDWKMNDQIVVLDMTSAFSLDGMSTSHPLKTAVNRPEDVNLILDFITYEKGACVLRMLEAFLGKEVYRMGLKRYLKAHEYGNAQTKDLWEALRKESCAQGKCVDVEHMMDTWTLQMGYPVVDISHSSGNQYLVSQERFLYDPNTNVTSKFTSPFDYKWFVPFTYITSSAPNEPKATELNMTSAKITWDGSGWIKGNVGQRGFYRVNYDDKNWDALAQALNTDHTVFNVSDRGGLIDDAFELAWSGRLNYTKALAMTQYLITEQEYVPWAAALKNFKAIRRLLTPTRPAYKYLQHYLLHQAETQYKRLGFTDQGSHLESIMRPAILETVCNAGEMFCLSNASKLFQDWMADPVKNLTQKREIGTKEGSPRKEVPANLRSFVYLYGISSGGVEEWDFAFNQFLQTSVASESRKLIYGLSGASEPWLLSRFLQYSMDPSKIKTQDTTYAIGNVAENSPIGRELAWNFILKHWNTLESRYGEGLYVMRRLLESITKGFTTQFQLDQLLAFIRERPNKGDASNQMMSQAVERVKANIEWIKRNERDLEEWLKNFLTKTGELKKIESQFSSPA